MAPLVAKTELYDVDVLQKLITKEGIAHKDKADLQRYRRRRINGNEVMIAYDYGKEYKTLQMGRIHPSPYCGLAIFPKDIRAALAQKYYWDIDIENAQPTLLVVLAKHYSVQCPALQEYCDRREEVLGQIALNHEMNRDEAKQICISVLFGGFRGHHELLPKMFAELKELSHKVAAENPKLFSKCKESNNPYASCLSVYIQNEERLILQQLDSFFQTKDRQMDVLIYDGGLVRKLSGEVDFPTRLLREAETHIVEKTGYKIHLAMKPMTHTFELEDKEQLLPTNLLINDEYAAKTFVKLVGDRLRKVDNSLWVLGADGVWSQTLESLRELIAEYSSRLVFRQPGAMGIKVHDYGGNEDKIPKMIKQIMIHAKKCDLPLQLAYMLVEDSNVDSESLGLFFELVDILVNHKEALRDYVLNWLAHILQYPFVLPGVALIVTGQKGYGKDTLFDFFGQYVLGSLYFSNYAENAQLFDHYDVRKVQKLLVKVEEADRAICMKNASALKGMITSDRMGVNPKNKQPFEVKNFSRFVFTTNKGNPVEFTDGERRFVLLASSGEKKGQMDFWTRVRSVLFTPQGGKEVADYLLKRDISSFVPQVLPPNEYQEAVVESELSVMDRFILDWDGEETDIQTLFTKYNAYCRSKNYLSCDNTVSFGRYLLAPLRDGKIVKRRSHGGTYYGKPEDQAVFLEED